jgi:hypothetical protein
LIPTFGLNLFFYDFDVFPEKLGFISLLDSQPNLQKLLYTVLIGIFSSMVLLAVWYVASFDFYAEPMHVE